MHASIAGVTKAEVLVVLLVVGILAALTLPSLAELLQRNRLKSATETLYASLQYAKSEAIKRNQRMILTFKISSDGRTWCYGVRENSACDCEQVGSCQIGGAETVVSSMDFPGVSMDPRISSPGDRFVFDSIRGTMYGTFGHVRLYSLTGKQTRVVVARIGRIRSCSPAGSMNVVGYPVSC